MPDKHVDDPAELNGLRRIRRLTEYRILCAALDEFIGDPRNEAEDRDVAKLMKRKYKARLDLTFQGAQNTLSGGKRTQRPSIRPEWER